MSKKADSVRQKNSVFVQPVGDGSRLGQPRGAWLLDYWLARWCLLLGLVIVATTVWGMVRQFSPVPYMDLWDGYIGFWHKIHTGDYLAWWRQHNEHRIVFSRLLFWADLEFFGGRNISTVAANFLLQASIAAVFFIYYMRHAKRRHAAIAVLGMIMAFRLSWIQSDNLVWGFQSQFIAVYLFALLAFGTFATVADGKRATVPILAAVPLGMLSVLSMSNGLLVFPTLVVQGVLLRMPLRRLWPVAVGWILSWTIYFSGYVSPPGHGNPVDALLHHIGTVLHFYLVFLGSPVFFLYGRLAGLSGLVLTAVAVFFALYLYARRDVTRYRSILLAIFCFCAVSALVAGLGRFNFGLSSAAASRYNTPALIAWLAVLLLVIDLCTEVWFTRLLVVMSLMVLPGFVYYQRLVRDNSRIDQRYWQEVGVLSMKLGVNDAMYMDWLYPRSMQFMLVPMAKYAQAENLSVYGSGWLHDAGLVRYDATHVNNDACKGSLEGIVAIPGGYRVSGWAAASDGDTPPQIVVLTDAVGTTVGYGVTGGRRPDVAKAIGKAGKLAGWTGYVLQSDTPIAAYLYDVRGGFCRLSSLGGFTAPRQAPP